MDKKLKDLLFKLFLLAIIEILCLNFYIIISAITGSFDWPIERLTTSLGGFLIQIINLIALIDGMVIGVYVIILIIFMIRK